MAKVGAKRTNSGPRSKSNRRHSLLFLFSARFVAAILIALLVSVLFFLRQAIAEAIISSLGLGIIPVALWILTLAFVLWRRPRNFLRNWNCWIGALLFTAALLAIMSLFRPAMIIAGVSLSRADVTLSGTLGLFIADASYTWARLLGLILLGVIFTFPRFSLNFMRGIASFIKSLFINIVIWMAMGFRYLIVKLLFLLLYLFRWIRAGIAGMLKPKRVTPKASAGEGVKEKATTDEVEGIAPVPDESAAGVSEGEEWPELPATNEGLPDLELLAEASSSNFAQVDNDERARLIEDALASYGIEAQVKQINPGPSVTQFGVEPGWSRKYKKVIEREQDGKPRTDKDGNTRIRMEEVSKTRIRVDQITSLTNDLALALAVPDIRIEAPVPGKPLIGIEVPNVSSEIVSLRGVVGSSKFQKAAPKSKLTLALGQGAGGEPMCGDLTKMPHLLIAGATGSGKTVCLNSIVCSLLMQATPADVRLVLIDPKRVEMVTFSEVPHLITPVITDVDKAIDGLRRVSLEMDNRYRKFSSVKARNIEGYNRNPNVSEKIPYIVVIIDELADLMMSSADVVEPLICRLAQLARATGIHLVIATQRPSVDVITGLIKANFPTRISFAVVSSVDSRTILDTVGAEKLLGRGDMLYIPPEASKPKRIRGCFVSDDEIERLVTFWKRWASDNFPPQYDQVARGFASMPVEQMEADPFLEKAKQLCADSEHVSISFLQRKLHIGYQRAAKLMEQLEGEGVIERGQGGQSEEEL